MTSEPTTEPGHTQKDPAPRSRVTSGDPSPAEPPPITFERASHDDLVAVSELLLRAIPDCVPQTVDQLWEREAETWVAHQDGGRIVASASLVPIHGERWELRSVIVDPSVRGQGVGQRLVGHLLNRRSIAGKEICCVTRHPRFFLRFGFEALGTPWETGRASCRSRKRIAMHRSVPRRLP